MGSTNMQVRKLLFYIIVTASTLVIIATLVSLVNNMILWYTKALDFPRAQYLVVAAICLLLFPLFNRRWNKPALALVAGLLASIVIQSAYILPYLSGPQPVVSADPASATSDNTVSIVLANVLVSNRSADELMEIVDDRDPDLVLTMEVDDWWDQQLTALETTYLHQLKYPADNGYGMSLYSKYSLEFSEIAFLKQDSVPSFHVKITLPSGKEFMFHGVHPLAPIPSDRFPDNANKKEVALAEVADKVDDYNIPAMVAGDFNDVSWSHTARLFGEQTQLRNVRLGRGLYNTFDAHSPFLRWPLDHYFVSGDFQLLELERLPYFGSDHFPMYAKFMLP